MPSAARLHYALSIAVAGGTTMADVRFGFVHDFGAREQWWATRGEGAWLDGHRLDPAAPERRDRDGRLELLGSSRRIRAGWPPRSTAGVQRPPPARLRDDRQLAVPGRGGAVRRNGHAAPLPWRGRAAGQLIVREAGAGRLPDCRIRSARRSTPPRAPPGGGRTARGPARARTDPGVIDWIWPRRSPAQPHWRRLRCSRKGFQARPDRPGLGRFDAGAALLLGRGFRLRLDVVVARFGIREFAGGGECFGRVRGGPPDGSRCPRRD